jgi:hypothetical protein
MRPVRHAASGLRDHDDRPVVKGADPSAAALVLGLTGGKIHKSSVRCEVEYVARLSPVWI